MLFRSVHFRKLRRVSGANGAFRGGTGQELLVESLNPTPAAVSFLAERTKWETAAPGIGNALTGMPGEVLIDGKPVDPKARHVVETGSKILLKTPGGGGYGIRGDRPRELIVRDLDEGYVP